MTRKYISFFALLALAGAVHADFSSSVGVEEMYDDNIYRLEGNEVDAWITKVKPTLMLQNEQGGSTYSLLLDAEAGIYSQSEQGDDDYTDYQAKGLANWAFDARNQVEVGLQHRKGHDERGTGRGDVPFDKLAVVADYDEPDEWTSNRVASKYTFGSPSAKGGLSAAIAYTEKDFVNNEPSTEILERDDVDIRLLGLLKVMPKSSLLLEARWKDIYYTDDVTSGVRDSTDMRYFIGVEWEATAKTSGSARFGYQEKDLDFSGFDDYDATTWEVVAAWAPKTYSTLELAAFRGADDSGDALSFVDNEIYSLRWNHDWSSRLTTTIFAQIEKEDYEGTSLREDTTDSWGLAANYLATKEFKINSEYKYEDRDSNIAGLDFRRNVVLFGAELSF